MTTRQAPYMIVGGSAAGMAAAQAICETDPKASVCVLSGEPDPPYFRPMIPYLVTGKKKPEDLTLMGAGPYRAPGIELHTNSAVAEVDVDGNIVRTGDGSEISFEKLLLATGSRPHIPPEIEGVSATGVFALRTLTHAREMAERANVTEHAVMLGGGLLNLKAAFALLERGVKVTLVVFSPQVLSQLMMPEDADLIRRALDSAGLVIKTGRSARAIQSGPEGVTAVLLDDGSEMACQMVCIGKGVRPNADIVKKSGIDIDDGIVVNRFTHTNRPEIHAAGDVAVTFDPVTGSRIVTGLWTNAVEMGRCAGFNMAGKKTAYGGTFGIMNATQLAGMPFVSMGTVHTDGGGFEVHIRRTGETYRKLVFDAHGERLVGALFVGDIRGAGLYRYMIRENRDVRQFKSHILDQSLHYGHLMLNRKEPRL